MIPKNIHGGFKTCGVYPFNRRAVDLSLEQHASFKPEAIVKKSKFKYIPVYSPAPVKKSQVSSQTTPSLTSQPSSKVDKSYTIYGALDKRRSYSESSLHDLESSLHDKTPDVTRAQMQSPDLCIMQTNRISSLNQFLVAQTPPAKKAACRPKASGRVLTSSECVKMIEEKERKKMEKLMEKDARKKQREEKRQERQLQKCQER